MSGPRSQRPQRSWWGQAWIDAVDQRDRLAPSQVQPRRPSARAGTVSPVAIGPGSASASVTGNRADANQVEITVRTFTDDEWRTLFDVLSTKVDHTAGLVDSHLDPGLVEDAADAGIPLLPRSGEIEVRCSCPEVATPCKHAIAVIDRVADQLDVDPFALLELRGRTREQVLAAIRRLRSEAAEGLDDVVSSLAPPEARPRSSVDDGIDAADAWSRRRTPLPEAPRTRHEPARPPAYSVDPPPDAGFDSAGLASLAADASVRAWRTLAEGITLGLDAGFDDDVIRRSATARHHDGFGEVARRLGTTAEALASRAAAWEVAGQTGVAIANEDLWPADPLAMSAARLAVEEVLRGHIRGDIDGNRITLGDLQLRLSQEGEWWSFQREGDAWLLVGGPVEAADELVEPRPGRRR